MRLNRWEQGRGRYSVKLCCPAQCRRLSQASPSAWELAGSLVVTAEMISGQFGVGYFTWESYTMQKYPDIIVGMLVIGVLGMTSSALIRFLGKRLTPWQQNEER